MPVYFLHVLYLCSSLLDGSIYSAHDAEYFYGHSLLFLHDSMVAHMHNPFFEFRSITVYTRR